jgi:hypothetical protein
VLIRDTCGGSLRRMDTESRTEREIMEPRHHAWLVPGRLAVAERPGGGGRAHRVARREAEQAWWRDAGVGLVVSCMPTRHGLLELALDGFAVRWRPIRDVEGAPGVIARVAEELRAHMDAAGPPVLVHGDHAGEWLAGLDAGLRLLLGLASSADEAVARAAADGLPVGSLCLQIVEGCARRHPSTSAA